MAIIYTSEVEATRDFASLMAHVRAGAEVIIEDGHAPVAVLRAANPIRRSISESIARAEAYTRALGHPAGPPAA